MPPKRLKAVVGVVLLAGCSAAPPLDEPQLQLEPIHVWTLTSDMAPTAASALSVTEVVFADRDQEKVLLLSDDAPALLAEFKGERVRALATEAESRIVWVAVGHRIMSIDLSEPGANDDLPVLLRFEFQADDFVSSLWASASQLWVALASGESSRVVVLDRSSEGSLSIGNEHDFPGRVAVFPLSEGAALVQELGFPFIGHELATDGGITATFRANGRAFEGIMDEKSSASWRVGAALPLGDNFVLMWLIDVRALQRLAVLTRRDSGAIVRATRVAGAIGLVHMLPGETDFILGSHEVPGGRQLVIYRVDWGKS